MNCPPHDPWPSAATTVVGVIGYPVAHSLSPLLHNTAFAALGMDWVSVGFPVPRGATASALAAMRDLGVAGLSVTMPHKSTMADLVDDLDPIARSLHAVNCCVRRGNHVIGANTDGQGFLDALARATGFAPEGRKCVVIGSGGAARAVALALAGRGARTVVIVARDAARAAVAARLAGRVAQVGTPEAARDAALVVNATPVGMAGGPATGESPVVPAGLLGPHQVVIDLVYHPAVTPWLAAAAQRGATTAGGLGMLVHQAAAQLALWTGLEAPVVEMWRAAERHARG